MSQRQVALAAALTAFAAAAALPVPWWLIGLVAATTLVWRLPVAVIVTLVLVGSLLAARAEAGIDLPDRSRDVTGRAALVSEPERRPGGVVVELRVEGRRYR